MFKLTIDQLTKIASTLEDTVQINSNPQLSQLAFKLMSSFYKSLMREVILLPRDWIPNPLKMRERAE